MLHSRCKWIDDLIAFLTSSSFPVICGIGATQLAIYRGPMLIFGVGGIYNYNRRSGHD